MPIHTSPKTPACSPICYELRIAVDEAQKADLVELLLALGEDTFVEGAFDCDPNAQDEVDYDPASVPSDQYEAFAAGSPVVFYDEDLARLEALRARIQACMADFSVTLPDAAFHLAPLADQNWRDSWKASFKPIDVRGVFAILPPWENAAAFSQPHKIIIDPGMAFGTGQHETTRLCLDMLLDLPVPRGVLDVGTGSGILAIAARMLGAHHIVGNDIDAQSVRIAMSNALVNLGAKGDVDAGSTLLFTELPVAALPDVPGGYDLIFANIQIKPLMRLTPDILSKASAHTRILFSGILVAELEEFLAYLLTLPVIVRETRTLGHWTGILCEVAIEHERETHSN